MKIKQEVNMIRKVILLLFLFSPLSYAVVAGGMVAIEHTWPIDSKFDKMTFFQQISDDGGEQANYFWGNQFNFSGSSPSRGTKGYIGLQNRDNGIHTVTYSIWNATEWTEGNCRKFSHEGSGVQCDIKFSWKTGHLYKLDVIKSKNGLVKGVVTDLIDKTTAVVGAIKLPSQYGYMIGSSGFVEELSQNAIQPSSCYMVGSQSSIFRAPIGDIGGHNQMLIGRQTIKTHGNCDNSYVVQAACYMEACFSIVNYIGTEPINSFVPIKDRQDITEDDISSVFDKVDEAIIDIKDGRWPRDVYLPEPGMHNRGKSIVVKHTADRSTRIYLNDDEYTSIGYGGYHIFRSDGWFWKWNKQPPLQQRPRD